MSERTAGSAAGGQSSIWGHQAPLERLRAEASGDRLSQSYLITGPAGVGKHSVALALATYVLCQGESPGCGVCAECRLLAAGRHPDLGQVVRDPENKQEKLVHIERIRSRGRGGESGASTLLSRVALKPLRGKRRVELIPEADLLSEEAGNALLKVLEEPPAGTVIILVSPDSVRLAHDAAGPMATLASRCREIALRPLPLGELARHLEEDAGVEPATAALLAAISGGRPGVARHLVEGSSNLELYHAALDRLAAGELAASAGERLARAVPALSPEREKAQEQARALLVAWRAACADLAAAASGRPQRAPHLRWHPQLNALVERRPGGEWARRANQATAGLQALEHQVNPRLTLEAFWLAA